MFGMLLNILVMAAALGVVVKSSLIQIGAPSWWYFMFLPILGLLCYVANCMMIHYYIQKRAPEFASEELVSGNIQLWELTAGLGIVPTWVSWIALLSLACFLALLMPLVAPLLQRG